MKTLSTLLILGLVLSLFVGVGVNIKTAKAAPTEWEWKDENGIVFRYRVVNDQIEDLYVGQALNPDGSDQVIEGTRNNPFLVVVPSSINGMVVKSIGKTNNGIKDSFFGEQTDTGSNIKIDTSGCTGLIKVNDYLGYGKTFITLRIPKTIKQIGKQICEYSYYSSSTIECNAINIEFGESTYNGIKKFIGFKNSTAGEIFTGERMELSEGATQSGSAKVTFDDNGGSGGSLPESLYVYTNDADNVTYIEPLLAGCTLPRKDYYDFKGYTLYGANVFLAQSGGLKYAGGVSFDTTRDNPLIASYEPKSIYVYIDGVKNEADPATTIDKGYFTLPSTTPKRTGYDFLGWTDVPNGNSAKWSTPGGRIDLSGFSINPNDPKVELYSVFDDKTYSFSFDTNGGAMNEARTQDVRYSLLASTKINRAPTKDGYFFSNWSVNGKRFNADDTFGAVISAVGADQQSVTLKAEWTKTASPSPTPTVSPSVKPSASPSASPSGSPSPSASAKPSATPTGSPSPSASAKPSATPTAKPTISPTPSTRPTATPTSSPADKKSVTVGGVTYRKKGDTAVVSGCTKPKATSLSVRTSVRIGEGYYMVTAIGKKALSGLKYLKKVKIGGYIKSIGAGAFDGCPKLKTITFGDGTLRSIGKNAFRRIYRKAVFRVPNSCYKDYRKKIKKKSVGWKKTMRIRKY